MSGPNLIYRSVEPAGLGDELVERWRQLQQHDEAYSSPYFCPEFTQAVARVRGDVGVIVIESHGVAVGFFPFQRAGWGVAKPVGGPFSDYHGVIAQAGVDWRIEPILRAAGQSVWVFDHLVGQTAPLADYVITPGRSPVIDLSRGFEAFEQHLKEAESDFLNHTRRMARKIAREVGDLRFEYHDPAALQKMIDWKSEQYKRSHPDGVDVVFVNGWTGALLRDIVEVQQEGFAGVCSSLYAGDRLVAVHMGMRSRTDWHYWFPAYDAELSKYSAGSILMLRMIEVAQSHGITLIDLGKGDSRYKSTLMTGARPLFEGAVELPSLLSAVRRGARAAESKAEALRWLAPVLNLPARALRKIERDRRFT